MTELQGLQLSMPEFRKEGANVVAICVDSVDENRKVVERLGLEYPILSDSERAALRAFDVLHAGASPVDHSDIARPATFIVSDGAIRWRNLTANYRVRPRPQTLLAALRTLRTERNATAR
jgi:peroxiredoxin